MEYNGGGWGRVSSGCVEEGGKNASESFKDGSRSAHTVGTAGKASNPRHRGQCVKVLRCEVGQNASPYPHERSHPLHVAHIVFVCSIASINLTVLVMETCCVLCDVIDRHPVQMLVHMQSAALCSKTCWTYEDVAPYILLDSYRRFGATCGLHLQGRNTLLS